MKEGLKKKFKEEGKNGGKEKQGWEVEGRREWMEAAREAGGRRENGWRSGEGGRGARANSDGAVEMERRS